MPDEQVTQPPDLQFSRRANLTPFSGRRGAGIKSGATTATEEAPTIDAETEKKLKKYEVTAPENAASIEKYAVPEDEYPNIWQKKSSDVTPEPTKSRLVRDSFSQFGSGLYDSEGKVPYVVDIKPEMIEKVSKETGVPADQALEILRSRAPIKTKAVENADRLLSLGVADPDGFVSKPIPELQQWSATTRDKLKQRQDQIEKEHENIEQYELLKLSYFDPFRQEQLAKGQQRREALDKESQKIADQNRDLDEINKRIILPQQYGQEKDWQVAGFEMLKDQDPTLYRGKLKTLKKLHDEPLSTGLPAGESAASLLYKKLFKPEEYAQARATPDTTFDENDPQSVNNYLRTQSRENLIAAFGEDFVANIEGPAHMNKVFYHADQLQKYQDSFSHADQQRQASLRQINEQRKKATTPQAKQRLDAQEKQINDNYLNNPDVQGYLTNRDMANKEFEQFSTYIRYYPKVQAQEQRKEAVEHTYNTLDVISRSMIGSGLGSGGAGLIRNTVKGFADAHKETMKTLMAALQAVHAYGVDNDELYSQMYDMDRSFDQSVLGTTAPSELKNIIVGYKDIPKALRDYAQAIGVSEQVFGEFGRPEVKSNHSALPMIASASQVIGNMAYQALLTKGIGGSLEAAGARLAESTLLRQIDPRPLTNVLAWTEKAKDIVSIFGSSYATTYGSNWENAIKAGLSEKDAGTYANLSSFGTSLTELINPDVKYLNKARNLALGKITGGAEIQALNKILKNVNQSPARRFLQFTGEYLKHTGQETVEEVLDTLKQHGLDAAYKINTTGQSLADDVENTIVQTALGMIPMSIIGGVGHNNHLNRQALWSVGNNPMSVLNYYAQKIDYAKGTQSSPESEIAKLETKANGAMKIANTMQEIIRGLRTQTDGGRPFTIEEKMAMAQYEFNRRKLEQDAGLTSNPVQKEQLLKAAQEQQKLFHHVTDDKVPKYVVDGEDYGSADAVRELFQDPEFQKNKGGFTVDTYNDPEFHAEVQEVFKGAKTYPQKTQAKFVNADEQESLASSIAANERRLQDEGLDPAKRQEIEEQVKADKATLEVKKSLAKKIDEIEPDHSPTTGMKLNVVAQPSEEEKVIPIVDEKGEVVGGHTVPKTDTRTSITQQDYQKEKKATGAAVEDLDKLEENRRLDNEEIDNKISKLDQSKKWLYDVQKDALEKQRKEINDYYDSRRKKAETKVPAQQNVDIATGNNNIAANIQQLEQIPYEKRTHEQHADFIKQKFAREFIAKGVPQQHVDAAVALMDARARIANPENPAVWYRKIQDIGNGDFQQKVERRRGVIRRGAAETLANGRKIIHALEQPNFTTAVHEFAHVFEDELTPEQRKTIQKANNHKEWTTETSEAFARSFETYLKEGKAPNEELRSIFEKAKQWISDIYNQLKKGTYAITPEVSGVFDTMFAAQPGQAAAVKVTPQGTAAVKVTKTPQQKQESLTKQAGAIEDLTDPHDIALQYFATGGKIHPSSVTKLFSGAEGERRARIGLMRRSAPTTSKLAHQFWETHQDLGHDTQAFENAIEAVLLNHNSQGSAAKALIGVAQSMKEDFSPEEVEKMQAIDEQLAQKLEKIVEDIEPDQREELLKILRRFQNKYGFVEWDKLEAAIKGFDEDILSLPESTSKALDGIVEKYISENKSPGQGKSGNVARQNTPGQGEEKGTGPPGRQETPQPGQQAALKEVERIINDDTISGENEIMQVAGAVSSAIEGLPIDEKLRLAEIIGDKSNAIKKNKIAVEYSRAKITGNNPELVKAVEESIAPQQQTRVKPYNTPEDIKGYPGDTIMHFNQGANNNRVTLITDPNAKQEYQRQLNRWKNMSGGDGSGMKHVLRDVAKNFRDTEGNDVIVDLRGIDLNRSAQEVIKDVEPPPPLFQTDEEKDAAAEVKSAQKEYNKATAALRVAEDKVTGTKGGQQSLLPQQGTQGAMFAVQRDEAKSILDPLRNRVKETKAALDQATTNLQTVINKGGNQGTLFQEEKETEPRNVTVPDGRPGTTMPEVVNGFYSPLEKIIGETKQTNMPARQWLDKFAKGDEAKWTGLQDWLSQQKGNVTKADIQDFLKKNRVQVVEVHKSDELQEHPFAPQEEIDRKTRELNRIHDNFSHVGRQFGYDSPEYKAASDRYQELKDWLVDNAPGWGRGPDNPYRNLSSTPTKYATWQLPGEKTNYKEILVLLPNNEGRNKLHDKRDRLSSEYRQAFDAGNYELANKIDSQISDITQQLEVEKSINTTGVKAKFKSGHWSEPDILVHLRMNTRTDANGNKVLFLEEIQSDWGQEGKKKGFKDAELDKKRDEAAIEEMRLWKEFTKELDKITNVRTLNTIRVENSQIIDEVRRRRPEIYSGELISYIENDEPLPEDIVSKEDYNTLRDNYRKMDRINDYEKSREGPNDIRRLADVFPDLKQAWENYDKGSMYRQSLGTMSETPAAPFVTETPQWTKLGLKVAAKEAVNQSADKIAWTTGEQQNARYDLSKQVDKILYNKNTDDGTYDITATKNREVVFSQYNVKPEKVEDYLGKEMAQRIINSEGTPPTPGTAEFKTTLEGTNLKIGGKGMIGYYGSPTENRLGIVGQVANKLFNQQPGTTQIDTTPEQANEKLLTAIDKDIAELESEIKADTITAKNKGIIQSPALELMQRTLDQLKQDREKILAGSASQQHSIDMTPELKTQVQKGLPLFQEEEQQEEAPPVNTMPDVVNGFYSPLEKIIGETKQNNMPVKQWLDKFAKSEEAKWTGLADWLSQQKGNLTKADVQDFLRNNRVQVTEIHKGQWGIEDFESAPKAVQDLIDQEQMGDLSTKEFIEQLNDIGYDADINMAGEVTSIFKKGEEPAQYAEYQTPGPKTNYKEILVTLPSRLSRVNEVAKKFGLDDIAQEKYGKNYSQLDTNESLEVGYALSQSDREKYQQYLRALTEARREGETKFRSGHWNEPDILVHLRMNTRTDPDGKKVLFLEEIQSDWGQKGKKKGFNEPAPNQAKYDALYEQERKTEGELNRIMRNVREARREQFKKRIAQLEKIQEENEPNVYSRNPQIAAAAERKMSETFTEMDELRDKSETSIAKELAAGNPEVKAAYDKHSEIRDQRLELLPEVRRATEGISKAPFVTETPQWTKLGLKVAAKEAVKQNADKISWTTGEQQNDRYSLSKVIDKIAYTKYGTAASDNSPVYEVEAHYKNGDTNRANYREDELENVVGKEIAQKIVNGEGEKNYYGNAKELKGLDLQVGGTGMIGYYGSTEQNKLGIVGQVAKKLFNQEPGTTTITTNEAENGYKIYEDGELIVDGSSSDKGEASLKALKEAQPDKNYTLERDPMQTSQQHSIEITPALQSQIEKGLPLFQEDEEQQIGPQALRQLKTAGTEPVFGFTPDLLNYGLERMAKSLESGRTLSEAVGDGLRFMRTEGGKGDFTALEAEILNAAAGGKPRVVIGGEQPQEQRAARLPEPGRTGAARAELDVMRQGAGISELPEKITGTIPMTSLRDTENVFRTMSKVQNEPDYVPTIHELNSVAVYTKGLSRQIEQHGDALTMAYDTNNLSEIKRLNELIEGSLKYFDQATESLGIAESRYGRGLGYASRNAIVNNIEDLGNLIARVQREANMGEPLTREQLEKYKEHWRAIKEANKKYTEKLEEMQAENSRLQAELEKALTVKRESTKTEKTTTQKAKSQYNKSRDKIRDIIRKAKGLPPEGEVKFQTEQGELEPDHAMLSEMYPHVREMFRSIMVESNGNTDIDTAVRQILADLHEDGLKALNERNVMDMISGYGLVKEARTKTQIEQQMNEMKREMELMSKLADLESGKTTPKNRRQQIKQSAKIKDLKQRIRSAAAARGFGKNLPSTTAALDSIKARYAAAILKYNTRIAEGDYVQRKAPNIELDPDGKKLRANYHRAKADYENAKEKDRIDGLSGAAKWKHVAEQIFSGLRTLKTTLDMSAILRQGALLGINNPKEYLKMVGKSFEFWSEARSNKWHDEIVNTDFFDEYINPSGLFIADQKSAKLTDREEAVANNWVGKIPVLGALSKASERSYAGGLNFIRYETFKKGAEQLVQAGYSMQNAPEKFQSLATYINHATGRGDLGALGLEGSSRKLSAVFFAPRFMASKLNLVNPAFIFGKKLQPAERIRMATDFAKFLLFNGMIMALASAGGADIEDDPTSSDFAKLRFGKKRVDFWGGYLPYINFVARGVTKKKEGRRLKARDLGTGIESFIQGKLAPVPGAIWSLYKGQDPSFQPVNVNSGEGIFNLASDVGLPIIVGNAVKYEITKNPASGLGLFGLDFFGGNVNVYGSRFKAVAAMIPDDDTTTQNQ